MATHRRSNGNLKYFCGICGASYARGFALNDHMKAAHPENYERVEDVEQLGVVEEYEIVEEANEADKNDDSTVYSVIMEAEEN